LERRRLVGVHGARRRVGQLARRGDVRRHAPELVLGQLEVADGAAELFALGGVRGRRLEGRLGHARRAAAGLEPSGGEALHLEVEALALAGLLADQILRRDEVALEAEREGVHAAIAGRGVGLAVEHAATRLALPVLETRAG